MLKKNQEEKPDILMKSNKFIVAKYDLQTVENRLFVKLLYEFQKNKNLQVKLHIDEIRELIKHHDYTTPKAISRIFTKLRTGTIYLKNENEWGECSFIYYWRFNEISEEFTVETSTKLLDLIENYIQVGYTPINLQIFFSLRNSYAQRFYDLLRLWSNTKTVITYTLEDLKELLMLENKYPLYADFKRRVIVPAIRELNNTGYFKIDFSEKKRGRKVVAIEFVVDDLDKRVYFDNQKEVIKKDTKQVKTKSKKTKFHNFDETYTQYSSEELDKLIEKSQKEKYK